MAVKSYANLLGDTAPWFSQRSANNPRYVFDTAAGRYRLVFPDVCWRWVARLHLRLFAAVRRSSMM